MKAYQSLLISLLLFNITFQQNTFRFPSNFDWQIPDFNTGQQTVQINQERRIKPIVAQQQTCKRYNSFMPAQVLPWWPWQTRCRLIHIYILWWPYPRICFIWRCRIQFGPFVFYFYVHYCRRLYWFNNQYRIQASKAKMSNNDKTDVLMSTNVQDIQKLTNQSFNPEGEIGCQQAEKMMDNYEKNAEAKRRRD